MVFVITFPVILIDKNLLWRDWYVQDLSFSRILSYSLVLYLAPTEFPYFQLVHRQVKNRRSVKFRKTIFWCNIKYHAWNVFLFKFRTMNWIFKIMKFLNNFLLAAFAENDLDDYHIVYPSLVSERGQFLSHAVHDDHVRRLRRSLDDSSPSNSSSEGHPLFYRLKLNSTSEEVYLELSSSKNIVAPGFVIERESGVISPYTSTCFYQGHVTGQANSVVAISNCAGLVSRELVIRLYFLNLTGGSLRRNVGMIWWIGGEIMVGSYLFHHSHLHVPSWTKLKEANRFHVSCSLSS